MNKPTSISSLLPTEFVYLHDIDPTILQEVRYAKHHNFIGSPLPGYLHPLIILTLPAALALKAIQAEAKAFGLTLKVYDAYRPQETVDYFIKWAADTSDQRMKEEFYPDIDKKDLFDLGYLGKKSTHTRGSTVDLTLVPLPVPEQPIWTPGDPLIDGGLPYDQRFADNSLDMGTGFDYFGDLSHPLNPSLSPTIRAHRLLLMSLMDKHGFQGITTEWWHFTLREEPFPDTYFNFPIQ